MQVVAEGLAFPEGPVVMADGSVIVVEILAGRITRCWNGRKETVCEVGGGPNGAAIGPDGALYVCNNGGLGHAHVSRPDRVGRIERVDLATGAFDRLYTQSAGRPLSAPNDLVFDCDGDLWFTDFGRLEENGKDFAALYCARPDGSSLLRIADKATSLNGVGLSPDMSTVFVADTFEARLYCVDRKRMEQTLRFYATAPGPVRLDSLAVTESGAICVATISDTGAITTVTPDGHITTTPTEDPVTTNIAFGGPEMRDAWITYSMKGMLVKARWPEPGLRLAFNR